MLIVTTHISSTNNRELVWFICFVVGFCFDLIWFDLLRFLWLGFFQVKGWCRDLTRKCEFHDQTPDFTHHLNKWVPVPTPFHFSSIILNAYFIILFNSVDQNIKDWNFWTFPTRQSLFLLFTGVKQVSVSCWADAFLMFCTVVNQTFMQHMKEVYLYFTVDDWISSIPFLQWIVTSKHFQLFMF